MNNQDDEIFNNICEVLYPEVINKINEELTMINLLSLIEKEASLDLKSLQNQLSSRDVHYRILEQGVANRVMARLKIDFPNKEIRHMSSWGQDPNLIVRD